MRDRPSRRRCSRGPAARGARSAASALSFAAVASAAFAGAASAAYAGDVTLVRDGPDVRVLGGSGDESIAVDVPAAGLVRIASAAPGTTVKGGSEWTIPAGSAGRVTIALGDGEDRVSFAPGEVRFDVAVRAGAGRTTVEAATSRFRGRFSLSAAHGEVAVSASDTWFARGLRASLRRAARADIGFHGCTFAGSVRVAGGSGDDVVRFDGDSRFGGRVRVGGGRGNDAISIGGTASAVGEFAAGVTFNGASGDDSIECQAFEATLAGPLRFLGGAGRDVMRVGYVVTTGAVVVRAGPDDDVFQTGDEGPQIQAGRGALIDGGPGVDLNGCGGGITVGPGRRAVVRGWEQAVCKR